MKLSRRLPKYDTEVGIVSRLNTNALDTLPATVSVPAYDRAAVSTGIVHFGPGAFHRAHQAAYIEDVLSLDPAWGICGVSFRSSGVRNALRDQDNLYTLALLGESTSYRIIGSLHEMLVAPKDPEAILERLTRPSTHVLSSTITEKGYCLTPDGDLDTARDEIIHDFSNPQQPVSAPGYLCEALRRRRASAIAPFVPLSCDNMADNGKRVRNALLQFAGQMDPELQKWIADEVSFPCTMVDSITPATDDALRDRVASDLGLRDAWPIQREPFTQWVIEDAFNTPRPPWEDVGATMTTDVSAFEEAKLRLLNGAHSSLAYLGSLAGHETVAEAMQDSRLVAYLRAMMAEEISTSLTAPAGLDLAEYSESILQRFENPNIRYMLGQIAWDSSQKIPFRLLMTIADNLKAGRPTRFLMLAVAAWMKLVCRTAADNSEHVDPLKTELFAIAAQCNGDARNDVGRFLALRQMFTEDLTQLPGFIDGLVAGYTATANGEAADIYAAVDSSS